MKNKYKISLLLFAFFIGYIIYSNKKFDGVWVEVYSLSPSDKNVEFEIANILEINNGKVQLYSSNEELNRNFFIFNNQFFLSRFFNDAKLDKINMDSMVFKYPNKSKLVFKKIPEIYKSNSKFDIKNKIFSIKEQSSETISTISFTDNALIQETSEKNIEIAPSVIRKINDFNIIQTQYLVLISRIENGDLFIHQPTSKTKFNKYKLTEIKVDNETTELIKKEKTKYENKMLEKETNRTPISAY